ncbi:hypothetical protein ACFQ48_03770 [Hymenobacter caeli]|uniref:Uncharacterized protein n=1 Tax=Hymenobacter caeli TaxID=2735894 RepID=A0ABX2FLG3_9BACT|nr:hypothetical protein [Hymenobacter caeli]NRT17965.1 hypothetical protein [Hymenobacter caeli]
MKSVVVAVSFLGLGLAAAPAARAQSAIADLPAAGGSAGVAARAPSRANMTPEEIKHEQQMQVLEARTGLATGNTSLGRAAGPARQFDTRAGGFTVRKFKAAPGAGKQERGQMHPAGGANPSGKPLVHNHPRKKHFLFF